MRAALFLRFFFWLWFAAAIAAGHFRLLQQWPPYATPAVVLGLTALLALSYFRFPPVREWVDAQPLRTLVLVHATRLAGIYFIVLYQRGELPRALAVPAGITDVIIATIALVVALAPIEPQARLRAIVIWNVVGFIDLILLLFAAARFHFAEPALLRSFTTLPLSLLPTLLVPLLLTTHLILFARALNERPAAK